MSVEDSKKSEFSALIVVLSSLGGNTIIAARAVAQGIVETEKCAHVRILEPALPLSFDARSRSITIDSEREAVKQRDEEIASCAAEADVVVLMSPVFSFDVPPGSVEWIRTVLGPRRLEGKLCASLCMYGSIVGVGDVVLARELSALGGKVVGVHPVWTPDSYPWFLPAKSPSGPMRWSSDSLKLCMDVGAHLARVATGGEKTAFDLEAEKHADYVLEHGPSLLKKTLARMPYKMCREMTGAVAVDKTKCVRCGRCTKRCPSGALAMPTGDIEDGVPQWDKEKCIGCGLCVVSCAKGALSSSVFPLKDYEYPARTPERVKKEVTQFAPTEEEQKERESSLLTSSGVMKQLVEMWLRFIWTMLKHPIVMAICGFWYIMSVLTWPPLKSTPPSKPKDDDKEKSS